VRLVIVSHRPIICRVPAVRHAQRCGRCKQYVL
jgi:hypothetical protein